MSGPDDENRNLPPAPGPSPWISREGDVVHPDAPAGSGGPGRFRTAGSLGAEGNDSAFARHPDAPSVRFETLSGDEKAEVLGGGVKVIEKERNPPPATVPGEELLKKTLPSFDLDVVLRILPDDQSGTIGGAKTQLDGSGVTLKGIKCVTRTEPGQTEANPTDKVIALEGKATISGTATIQVIYGKVGDVRVRPDEEAAWGRGTTTEDAKAKNITVGFHESRHREDYLAHLRATLPIQSTRFRVGMTVAEFDAEWERIAREIDRWFETAETTSRARTDEVGTTMSSYVASHPGSTGH